jgi:imidazolonepropionase-like amidohydrolase
MGNTLYVACHFAVFRIGAQAIKNNVMAGLKPAEALKITTRNSAKYSQVLKTAVSISPGKQADLILADGDPSANISDIRKVSMTMKSGLVFFRQNCMKRWVRNVLSSRRR